MKRRLFWKLSAIIVAGTILLFWLIHFLMLQTEHHMSHIDTQHQQTLRDYAAQAEKLYLLDQHAALAEFLRSISQQEQTWVALVQSHLTPLAGSGLSQQFHEGFRLGRNVEWKIHLYFEQNPIIDLTFADGHTHFLITLPTRMRPGSYWFETSLLLQIALPMLLMTLLSVVIYRHVMNPLQRLQKATQQFSEGHFDVRMEESFAHRHDEFTAIAHTFDNMAERIGELIESQRHLTDCLSHELRTPLTRVELAISQAEAANSKAPLARIREECQLMRNMVEDALTLAWLEREKPELNHDKLDLTDLIDSIVSDARFEFPEHVLLTELPEHAPIFHTSQRALGQAIENVIRNALTHTPAGGTVIVRLLTGFQEYEIQVDDQGPGIPEKYLNEIFRPFFRLADRAERSAQGFGIGLSLAQREIVALGGQITAYNLEQGLRMVIRLPSQLKSSEHSP